MAFSGSSIVIVCIVVIACASAGPVQGGLSIPLQRNEYGSPALADFLAKYWEDRKTIQDGKWNLDQIGGGHLMRDTDKQFRRLFDKENRPIVEHVNGKQMLNDREGSLSTAERLRGGNSFDSNIDVFANTIDYYPYSFHLNGENANDKSVVNPSSEYDITKDMVREGDRRFVKNLDQIGGGHLVRNLDQIGGGHLVRNLDQIGGGHLVRNLDQIGGGNLLRSVSYPYGETKLHFTRNLDQIGGGNLVRNLDQIGGGNLVRNLDQIGGGNLVRSLE